MATCQVFWPLFVHRICSNMSGVISSAAKDPSYTSGFALHWCRLESNLKSSGCLFQVNCSWQFPFNFQMNKHKPSGRHYWRNLRHAQILHVRNFWHSKQVKTRYDFGSVKFVKFLYLHWNNFKYCRAFLII